MGLTYYIKNPIFGLRKLLYYIIGNTIGRVFYSSAVFRSRWFRHATDSGWEWVTRGIVNQKVCGRNAMIPWPVSPFQSVLHPENISFNFDDLNNFQVCGSYFQAKGKIIIGTGTYIAPNVGLITANHDFSNLDNHSEVLPISIGKRCWIGMNSVILPGVTLGDNIVVGAGSVVTKSFPEGHVVIAGTPAKIIKNL